jgi:hypothetical protein
MSMMGVENARSGVVYVGPANVVASPIAWWGLRAVSAAYATGLNKIANICTPADAVCADVKSDASGNFNLAGTGSLTCNNGGSICTIKILYDQSGALSCGGSACDLTQATIGNRAILVVPAGANGCSTTSNFCAIFASGKNYTGGTIVQAQAFTLSTVYKNTSGVQSVIFGNNSTNIEIGANGSNGAFIFAGVSAPSATAADNVYHAIQGVFNNTTSDINVDGSANSVSVAGTTGMGNTITLGNNGAGGGPFIGNFVELGAWGSGFSGGTSSSMSTNQHTYWGF